MASAQRVLVVEDEPEVADLVQEALRLGGLEVRLAVDAAGLWSELARAPADLVVLDRRLPDGDGLELARRLAAGGRPGVLLLTGLDGLPARLEGLAAGADDYLAKPFEPRELLARARSVLRRLPPAAPGEPVAERALPRFGRGRLDLQARRAIDDQGREIPLTPMEVDLLAVFARHPRQVLARERLVRLAHDRELEAFDRSVDIRMTRLRQKLEPDPARPRWLLTVRGQGYRWEPTPEG
jgi:two-component system phosphate regulon response regulator OmpR